MFTMSLSPKRPRTTGLIKLSDLFRGRPWIRSALAWAATVFWGSIIFWFSGGDFGGGVTEWVLHQALRLLHLNLSAPAFDLLHFGIRKLAHLTEYATFSVLIYFSLESPKPHGWRARTAFWSIVLAGLYSLSDELHQSFVPGRGPSLKDCGIDTIGATFGMLAVYHDARRSQATTKTSAAPSASTEETKNGVAGE